MPCGWGLAGQGVSLEEMEGGLPGYEGRGAGSRRTRSFLASGGADVGAITGQALAGAGLDAGRQEAQGPVPGALHCLGSERLWLRVEPGVVHVHKRSPKGGGWSRKTADGAQASGGRTSLSGREVSAGGKEGGRGQHGEGTVGTEGNCAPTTGSTSIGG